MSHLNSLILEKSPVHLFFHVWLASMLLLFAALCHLVLTLWSSPPWWIKQSCLTQIGFSFSHTQQFATVPSLLGTVSHVHFSRRQSLLLFEMMEILKVEHCVHLVVDSVVNCLSFIYSAWHTMCGFVHKCACVCGKGLSLLRWLEIGSIFLFLSPRPFPPLSFPSSPSRPTCTVPPANQQRRD